MYLIAIPFSDLAGGARAVETLLSAPRPPGLEVELIAMVEPLRPGKVAVFVSAETAERQVREAAGRWLLDLEARLEQAGVVCRSMVAVGPSSRTLRLLAGRRDISQIMMPEPASAPWRRRLGHAALRGAQPAITFVP